MNVEELRSPIAAMIVRDADLGKRREAGVELASQFDADRAAVALELDRLQPAATDQPEVAIDVANRYPKQGAHQRVFVDHLPA